MRKSILILLAILTMVLPSCGSKEPEGIDYVDTGKNVAFSCHTWQDYSDMSIQYAVTPYIDTQNKNVTICSRGADDAVFLTTLERDGSKIGKMETVLLPSGFETAFFTCGFLSAETAWFVTGRTTDPADYTVFCWDRTTDQINRTIHLDSISSIPDHFQPCYLALCDSGCVLIASQNEIVALAADDACTWSLTSKGVIQGILTVESGETWCALYDAGGLSLCRLNLEKGVFDDKVLLQSAAGGKATAAGDLIYYTTAAGICSFDPAERSVSCLELNYIESGITANTGMSNLYTGSGSEEERLFAVIDSDTMLFAFWAEGAIGYIPRMYCRQTNSAENVRALTIAHAHPLTDELRSIVIGFKKDHPEWEVDILDYSIYTNDENEDYGARKMVTDILNGLIRPDIVLGSSEDESLLLLADKGVLDDLYVYFGSRSSFLPNDLFGCVKEAFTDKSGGLWGISPWFRLNTVFALDGTIDDYITETGSTGIRATWSLEDFLNLAETVPADIALFPDLKQSDAENPYFVFHDYSIFINTENGTCSFDSDLFLRWLKFCKNLPNDQEFRKTNPLPSAISSADFEAAFAAGDLLLLMTSLRSVSGLYAVKYGIHTEACKAVGYPSDGTGQHVFYADTVAAVIKDNQNPDACGVFLDALLDIADIKFQSGRGGIPTVISIFDTKYDRYQQKEEEAAGQAAQDPDRILPCEEDKAQLKEMLESGVRPLIDTVLPEVNAIIAEELSSLFAGKSTPESCAQVIQSRVGIWAAEQYGN